jgi:ZIP family zinc transporter
MVGGVFALRFRDRLHLVLSLSAGVLLGVVCFDLLPEIFQLIQAEGRDPAGALVAVVAGFLVFHAVEKLVLVHHSHEVAYVHHHHPRVGVLSVVALAGHSFMDGVAIGLGFQAAPAVGIVVALAVIAHDFCDGLNAVSLMLVHENSQRRTFAMLAVDAAAPALGAVSTLVFRVPPSWVVSFLGFFAGFLLYIAAGDILPEAHSRASPRVTLLLVALTSLGAAIIFVAIRLVK